MGYLPIFVNLAGWPCVVIGGDKVAESRVRALLADGAEVTVVSASVSSKMREAADSGKLRHVERTYQYGDLRGNRLAYVTTDDPEVTRRATEEARESGILINVVDYPSVSEFISPAMVRRGELQIAISTGGASPALAGLLRERLEQLIGPQYGLLVEIMGRARGYLRQHETESAVRARTMKSLATVLLDGIQVLDEGGIDGALRQHLGIGLEELGVGVKELGVLRADRPD
jgi:siroheme synthase-like protein